jgi:hypothetical protein
MLLVRVQRVLRRARAGACTSTAPPVARASLSIGASRLLIALVAVACGFPAPEACELACGDDGACPGGFECQASSLLCVPRGTPLACTPRIPPEGNGNDDAGVGGAGPFGPPDAAAGGTSAAGGEAGSAGAAGAPSVSPLAISAVGTASESGCTGVALGRSLQASGGVSPYAWRVVEAPPGARSTGASGERFELDGVPSEPGRVLVEVQDASGETARTEVVVYERPEVSLERLPAICEGEGYGAWLAASGGEPDSYVWSARRAPDDAALATLEELGLRVEGSWLTGEVVAGSDEAPLRVIVDVRDAHCQSSGVELELEVISSDSDECPTIELAEPAGADALPAPCLGNFYAEALTVAGGQEPYLWSEVSAPPGLYFDVDTATVQGIAEGDGVLTVEVTDANAHTVQKSYAVETRDRCWLAFVASEPAPAHLALVDGRLVERQPSARRTLPEGAGSDPVVDFQFSPDGRFIAYRLGAGPSALRLELARLSNGRSQAIPTEGSVIAYAWSNDASTLAIAVDAEGRSLLGGIDVSAVDPVSLDPDVPLDAVRALGSVAAPPPDSALGWYAENRLAFLASAAGAERRLVTAALERERFAPPLQRGGFSSAARLSAGAGGVFVAEPATGLHEFFADGVGPSTLHAEGSVLSASGAYAGLARDGAVQIFRPERASSPAGSPSLAASGCSTLLAWAGEHERIACAGGTAAEDRVAWFEISAAGDAITALGSLGGASPSAEQAGQRRAFSARGRWFAFTTREGVSVARVEPGAPRLQLALPAAVVGGTPSVLSFSPDESFLAVGAANTLGLIDLEQGAASYVALSPSAVFNELCSERFVDGAAEWCGSASREPDVSWSRGSDLIAFRSSLGTLQLIDLSRASEGRIGAPLSPDACFEGCSSSSSARFQP